MTCMHAGVPVLQDVTAGTHSCLEHRFIASVGCRVYAAAGPRVCAQCVPRYDRSRLTSLNADCLSDTCATQSEANKSF